MYLSLFTKFFEFLVAFLMIVVFLPLIGMDWAASKITNFIVFSLVLLPLIFFLIFLYKKATTKTKKITALFLVFVASFVFLVTGFNTYAFYNNKKSLMKFVVAVNKYNQANSERLQLENINSFEYNKNLQKLVPDYLDKIPKLINSKYYIRNYTDETLVCFTGNFVLSDLYCYSVENKEFGYWN